MLSRLRPSSSCHQRRPRQRRAIGHVPLYFFVSHWASSMITFQTNPKLPDFMYLLTDEAGRSLLSASAGVLKDDITIVFPNDTSTLFVGWKIVDAAAIDTVYSTSSSKQRLYDRIGLFSCALILTIGVTLGVSLGTLALGLIAKLFS